MNILHATWLQNSDQSEEIGLFIWVENVSQAFSNLNCLLDRQGLSSIIPLEGLDEKMASFSAFSKLPSSILSSSKVNKIVNEIFMEPNQIYPNYHKMTVELPCVETEPILSTYFLQKDQQSHSDVKLNNMFHKYDQIVDYLISSNVSTKFNQITIQGILVEYFDIPSLFEHLIKYDQTTNMGSDFLVADDFQYWIDQYNFIKDLIIERSIYPKFIPNHQILNQQEDENYSLVAWWDYYLTSSNNEYFQKSTYDMPYSASFYEEISYEPFELQSLRLKYTLVKSSQMLKTMILDSFLAIVLNMVMRVAISKTKQDLFLSAIPPNYRKYIPELKQSLFTSNIQLDNFDKEDLADLSNFLNQVSSDEVYYNADEPSWNLVLKIEPPMLNNIMEWRIQLLLRNSNDESIVLSCKDLLDGSKFLQRTKYFVYNTVLHDPINLINNKLSEFASDLPFLDEFIRIGLQPDYQVSVSEIFELLDYHSRKLSDNGCDVLLPKHLEDYLIPKEKVKFDIEVTYGGDILKYDLSLMIKNSQEKIPFQEILRMSSVKRNYVKIAGRWIYFDKREAIKISRVLRKHLRNLTPLDAIRLEAGDFSDTFSDFITSIPVQVHANLNRIFQPPSVPVNIPDFNATLRPYQQQGVSWLLDLYSWQLSGCLADDMGLGKTIQVLAFLKVLLGHHKSKKKTHTRSLIVVPTMVLRNWENETCKFFPDLRIIVHHDKRSKTLEQLKKKLTQNDILITTYGTMYKDVELLQQINWDVLVIDEAQTIKNSESKIFKCLKAIQSSMRIALTGTPLENKLGELWSIFQFLLPNYLGSLEEFNNKFSTEIETDPDKMSILNNLTKPFILRRSKIDRSIVPDLPKKIEKLYPCPMTAHQISLYEATMSSCLSRFDNLSGSDKGGLILSTITKLKQICNHPSTLFKQRRSSIQRSGKVIQLIELIQPIMDQGEKALVFTQFKEMGSLLEKILTKHFKTKIHFINGDVSNTQRDKMIQNFNSDPKIKIMILTIQAGGVGINLTAANHVIHYDRWWNPSVENQATDRAYRIGQTKDVKVYKLTTKGTIEERIGEIINNKTHLFSSFISGVATEFKRFNQNKLYDLLKLQDVTLI